MGFYTTDERAAVLESCQENPVPPSKNRVWNFFTTSETCTGFSESQPVEPHQEKLPTPTTTASGVRYYGYRYYQPEKGRWASRDPIGEMGFDKVRTVRTYLSHRNVSPEYVFCANRVIDAIDPFGLTFVPPAPQYCYTVCDPIFGGGCYTVCLPPPPPPTTADCVCASGTKKGKHQNPNYNNVVNGCTGVGPGPFNFTPACNQHDTCYGTCNAGRGNCDQQFLSNMQSICSQNCGTDQNCLFWCNATAQTYYNAVRMVGNSHYDGDGAACEDCCCP